MVATPSLGEPGEETIGWSAIFRSRHPWDDSRITGVARCHGSARAVLREQELLKESERKFREPLKLYPSLCGRLTQKERTCTIIHSFTHTQGWPEVANQITIGSP